MKIREENTCIVPTTLAGKCAKDVSHDRGSMPALALVVLREVVVNAYSGKVEPGGSYFNGSKKEVLLGPSSAQRHHFKVSHPHPSFLNKNEHLLGTH